MIRDRRSLLRFAAGIGLGAVVAEIYERLYNIPELERGFRSEVTHWMNEYNSAKEMVEKLSQQLNVSRDEISGLSGEVNNWKNQYNAARDEVNRLGYTVNTLDELEKESTAAISFYRERMEEAIRRLKNTIEKYRAILGDERVSFESSSLKVLEDLKVTQENLLKVLSYFPLIKSFGHSPLKVVNDKIYDLSVTLEVISPLNTLKEIEVKLIPVEYRYFITDYGMREGDYDNVFPKEEIKKIKLQPKGLEREMFNVTFTDLKGGKEYLIKAIAKDVADGTNSGERKIPYIREFENIAPLDDITVIADYYVWWGGPPSYAAWRDYKTGMKLHTYTPILGEYDSGDPIVVSKHIDWATGHGMDAFSISWWTTGKDEKVNWHYQAVNILRFLDNPLSKDIKFLILYENNGRLRTSNTDDPPTKWIQDLDDPFNRQRIITDLDFLASNYFQHPRYLKIRGKPVIDFDYTIPFRGDITGVFAEARSNLQKRGIGIYLMNDLMGRSTGPYDANEYGVDETHFRKITQAFDCISASNFPGNYDDVQKDIQFVEKVYKAWREYADLHGKDFIPAAWPGHQSLARTPERQRRQIEIAKKFTKLNVVSIISFNEWISSHHIEPSSEEKFKYLESLRQSIG
jgi:archaellum component FlaC